MAGLLTDALWILYEGDTVSNIYDSLANIMDAVQSVVKSGFVSDAFSILSAIAAAFLLLYFWLDLMDQTMRDLFSFEKLCVSFIKLVAVFALLIVAEDLIEWIVEFGDYVFNAVSNSMFVDSELGSVFEGIDKIELRDYMDETLWGGRISMVIYMVTHLKWTIYCVAVDFIDIIIYLVADVVAISAALTLLVRLYWSPIAIVQAYSGVNSPGIRYVKSILADVCTLAGMLVVAYAAWQLSSAFIGVDVTFGATLKSSSDELEDAISVLFEGSHMVQALVPQFAVIGGMSGVSRVMHDVFA